MFPIKHFFSPGTISFSFILPGETTRKAGRLCIFSGKGCRRPDLSLGGQNAGALEKRGGKGYPAVPVDGESAGTGTNDGSTVVTQGVGKLAGTGSYPVFRWVQDMGSLTAVFTYGNGSSHFSSGGGKIPFVIRTLAMFELTAFTRIHGSVAVKPGRNAVTVTALLNACWTFFTVHSYE
jgi:hypothetical protein